MIKQNVSAAVEERKNEMGKIAFVGFGEVNTPIDISEKYVDVSTYFLKGVDK